MGLPDSPSLQSIFVGRQPIYGRRLDLYAYELLYRGADVDFADFEEGDRATSQVLLNTFTEFGIERVVGPHLAFVNLTRGFLVGEYPLSVPRTQVVLEVLEDVEPDPEVIAGMRELRRRGFRIALDDFIYRPEFEPMLALADIVKLDILGLEEGELRERYEKLKPYGTKLLAEKIETREEFEFCRDLGFDYFQGYFLARPNTLSGTSVTPSRLNLLRLLAEIQDPDCNFDRVQEIVAQDVTLSYRLLRQINSALYAMPRRIDSIKETVCYLGIDAVKNVASLSLLSAFDNTPHELVKTAMLRARMCELLAKAARHPEPQRYFTAGLFSTLDAMMGVGMGQVLPRLSLTDELEEALVDHCGPIGEALATTLAYENGDWDHVGCFDLSRAQIKGAFLDAVEWVESVDREILGLAA